MKKIIPFLLLIAFSCKEPETTKTEAVTDGPIAMRSVMENGNTGFVLENKDTIELVKVEQQKTGTYNYTEIRYDTLRHKYKGSGPVDPIPPDTDVYAYKNGYDTDSDINDNQLGRGSISKTVFKTGPGSFRSEVRSGDQQISGGWRSEQQYGSLQTPREGVVEYDVYYEVPFQSNGHSFQWHPTTSGASATLALWHSGGNFQVVRSVVKGTNIYGSATMKIIPKKWYKMRWEYKFTSTKDGAKDGYVRLYIDGSLYYSASNVITADGSGQYLKVGQNMFNGSTSGVAYYDNLKITKK